MHFRASNLCYSVSVVRDRGYEKILTFANGRVLKSYPVNPYIGLWTLAKSGPHCNARCRNDPDDADSPTYIVCCHASLYAAASAIRVAMCGCARLARMLPAAPSATVLMLRAVALMISHFGFGESA